MKVWGRPTSTNTQRVLWALTEAAVPYQLILASGTTGAKGYVWRGEKPFGIVETAEYRAMNPNGTIPTIADGDFTLWESNAIVSYVARRYAPDKLFGNNEATFALAMQWMIWTNSALDHPLHALVMHLERLPENQRSPDIVETSRQEMLRKLELMEARLGNSPYLAGTEFSMGDIPPAISLQRFLHFKLNRTPTPRLDEWLARIRGREGFRTHVAPREKHLL